MPPAPYTWQAQVKIFGLIPWRISIFKYADPVYRMLTDNGLPEKDMPKANHPIHGLIGYHLRDGKHDVTSYDWKNYLLFANKHLK